MGVNTYRKGNRNQQKAKRFYESLGYDVEVVRRDRWKKDQDFFGLWDLICVSDKDVIFVQVKTNAKPTGEWIDKARNWRMANIGIQKEYAIYKDYERTGDRPWERIILDKSYSGIA